MELAVVVGGVHPPLPVSGSPIRRRPQFAAIPANTRCPASAKYPRKQRHVPLGGLLVLAAIHTKECARQDVLSLRGADLSRLAMTIQINPEFAERHDSKHQSHPR